MTLDITKCHAGGLDMSEACAAGGGVCQHHGVAYAEVTPTDNNPLRTVWEDDCFTNGTIAQVQITITETCCVIVNAAIMSSSGAIEAGIEIERPLGTIRTQQRDSITAVDIVLLHHAAWEVLPPGVYTYFLMNRTGSYQTISARWIKAIASDCEG